MNTHEGFLVEAGETRANEPFDVLGNQILVKLGGSDTRRNYAIVEDIAQPQAGPPLHIHSREDETFYVIEGEFLFEVDGKQFQGGPGCLVHAPRGLAHAFQNISTAPARMLTIVQPAGLDVFFAELDAAVGGGQEPDLSVVVPIFEKYGMEVVGPPLAERSQISQRQAAA